MPDLAHVAVHPSVFPDNVRHGLLQSLRARRIDPKFHYASYEQSQKWLALHEAFSPSRTDADCAAIYKLSFQETAAAITAPAVHLIGLGCGGGQKDARLLSALAGQGRNLAYSPCDISLALVLTSQLAAQNAVPRIACHPLVCDLAALPELTFDDQARIITFFGMIPNFEPEFIMPRLAGLVRPGDFLLLSANLAPGPDYTAGVQKVLPGYDNLQTRDWLLTFLYDLGVEPNDGSIQFSIEDTKAALKRIVADFRFARARTLSVHGERFDFRAGDTVLLFFSYRYTPERMASLLAEHELSILAHWTAKSEEEAVFLCRRAGD